MANSWNGLLLVNKEAGFTSNDVVAKLRGILKQKKIGHTGTLDPDAVGLLVVCLGNATRAVELLTEHDKEYIAVVQLGIVTDTQDTTGEVLEKRDASGITHEKLSEALQAFKGDYDQIPPMYSAIRMGGKHLYELAREGRTVERKPRRVTIDAISLVDDGALSDEHRFTMEVRCSKGTYIRTLCHDIGERLGCGAAMGFLLRTAVGSFRVDQALTLTQIEACRDDGTLTDHILPVEGIFRGMDRVTVREEYRLPMENGNPFPLTMIREEDLEGEEDVIPLNERYRDGEPVRVYCGKDWFGIYRYSVKTERFLVDKFFYGV